VARKSIVIGAGALCAAAVLGGGAALAGAAAFGDLGSSTTEVREVAAQATPAVSQVPPKALSIGDIYQRSSGGVVQVTSTSVVTVPADPFFGNLFPSQQQQRSLGSGFVIDKTGHIVTNYHVVQGAKKINVSFSNGASTKATIVGVDPSSDIAVLKVGASSRALTPLPLGNSDEMRVGDPVVAIGNPFGLDRTVTAGIVSAIQRAITAPNGYTIDHVIQTDAAINHGNSGGPLLNAQGQVIGITSQILSDDQNNPESGNIGIGFAIPINTAKQVGEQIINSGKAEHTYLGVEGTPLTPDIAKALNIDVSYGVLVAKVEPGSPAA
jgi:S1-C subfamily serine protease